MHGLGANVDWSWTWKGDTKERSVHWLKDAEMLPNDVPSSRIMVYNYESTWHADAPKTRLQLCGEDLVKYLQTVRKYVPNRPVLFIGHSIGGLVIQHVSEPQAETGMSLLVYYMLTVRAVETGVDFCSEHRRI